MTFKDYFSSQSDVYRTSRPDYPDSLFNYLSEISAGLDCCWDVGCGNGQAAVMLSKHFKKVYATDPSEAQIKNAFTCDRVIYSIERAENCSLPNKSVDLIVSAQAAHWFKHDVFYSEAIRVAKPDAILCIWCYSEAVIDPKIDSLTEWFMYQYMHDYWPDERWYVRNQYKEIPFPFKEISVPEMFCEKYWTLAQWMNYMSSWSAYVNCKKATGKEPLDQIADELKLLWKEDEVKQVKWPLHIKCARINTTV